MQFRSFVRAALVAVVVLTAAALAGCGGAPGAAGTLTVDSSPRPALGQAQLRLRLESLAGTPVEGVQATVDVDQLDVNGTQIPAAHQRFTLRAVPWVWPIDRAAGADRLAVQVVNYRTGTWTSLTLGREFWGLEYILRDVP